MPPAQVLQDSASEVARILVKEFVTFVFKKLFESYLIKNRNCVQQGILQLLKSCQHLL